MAFSGVLQQKRKEETKKPKVKIPPINDIFNEFERTMLGAVGYSRKSEQYRKVFQEHDVNTPRPIYGQSKMNELIGEYDRYTETGSRFPEPSTWITKRRDFMKKRYTGSPSGGFSGTLGAGGTKKQLLGA